MLPLVSSSLHGQCTGVSVLLLDCVEPLRERRADCLRRWGHAVDAYAACCELPPPSQMPPKAVLIVRQELPQGPGIECIRGVQDTRSDIPAILMASGWSAALAAAVSSRKSVWLRKEPMNDEELHVLVDFCSPR